MPSLLRRFLGRPDERASVAPAPAPAAPRRRDLLDVAEDPEASFREAYAEGVRHAQHVPAELVEPATLAVRFAVALSDVSLFEWLHVLSTDSDRRVGLAQVAKWRNDLGNEKTDGPTRVHDAAGDAARRIALGAAMKHAKDAQRDMRDEAGRATVLAWLDVVDEINERGGQVVGAAGYYATRPYWDHTAAGGHPLDAWVAALPFSRVAATPLAHELPTPG